MMNIRDLTQEQFEREYIKLPCDSCGDVVRVGERAKINEAIFTVLAVSPNTILGQRGDGTYDICSPKEITLHKAPYDKHGVEIKVGDWVRKDIWEEPYHCIMVESDHFYLDALGGNSRYRWTPENAHLWEVVPEPDSQEKIDADAKKIEDSCTYWSEDASCNKCTYPKGGKRYENCDIDSIETDAVIDLLRRQRALDGVK